ncbi:MAG: hypothetical protein AB7R40_01670 [Nitrospiraceae bacterium]
MKLRGITRIVVFLIARSCSAAYDLIRDRMMGRTKLASLRRVMSGCLICLALGCAAGKDPGVKGPYNTWDDVINRWIGKPVPDLYLELGPPNLHPHEVEEGMTEMVWDFGIDRMPGQADEYGLLPMYGFENCHLYFFADQKEIVRSGKRVGCE